MYKAVPLDSKLPEIEALSCSNHPNILHTQYFMAPKNEMPVIRQRNPSENNTGGVSAASCSSGAAICASGNDLCHSASNWDLTLAADSYAFYSRLCHSTL